MNFSFARDFLQDLRRDFHKFPEPSWLEFRTSAKIAEWLEEFGYQVFLGRDILHPDYILGLPAEEVLEENYRRAEATDVQKKYLEKMKGGLTGVVAELFCGEGPTLALRFDIDANDLTEAKDESHRPFREGFSSLYDGCMHACGHDGHSSIGLGLARLLSENRSLFKGKIRLIFQAAEEGARGALPMLKKGILDDVDYLLGLHIGFQARELGELVCASQKFLASSKLDLDFYGRSSHAAAEPELGRNALLAGANACLNIQALPRHSQGASRLGVGKFVSGEARNIVPDFCHLELETRGESDEIDDFYRESIKRIAEASSLLYEVKADLKLVGKAVSGDSDLELGERIFKLAQKNKKIKKAILKRDFKATEDFSYFLRRVQENGGQASYLMLGTEIVGGHHNNYFDFNEDCLFLAVEILASIVQDILGK